LQNLGELEGAYIAAAIIPGFIIAVLFYFDHNVSSQMAQQEDFNLKKPAAYNCKDVRILLLPGPPVLRRFDSPLFESHGRGTFPRWTISDFLSSRG
jgi:hypothetical protein